ncbi:MAG: DUF4157 domain-containing protein [Candidatus Brocadia sp. AMX2]|nr:MULTISPECIES: DUF4157 domain-containing protein [Brocadia]KXK30336.1 MAG: hypothetical protein UZ01_01476 [Candidatus Brocadia sinica]MBC6931084.1 DUF4157 domain-containing protein [Candidatus Brocadia sp.]MBL1168139.1 DUF4157 domain-containing protein [Candidatus Brocadia sp. AMX1]NOG40911.1 DUF4157 domain-containing protein [Planctomycetota bacterium]KAA0241654.1 MAG: DUF4157 domain-containing protein [Candidatus Brocadia sp. AMX2]
MMIGTKEWKRQNGESSDMVKRRDDDAGLNPNPCGGCNTCHQMTRIHAMPTSHGRADDGGEGPDMQKPCASNFFQRNLGNSYMQAVTKGSVPMLQRKCACGGSCASCAEKEEALGKIQTKLTIGQVNDVYEQEADRVADQIIGMADSLMQAENEQPSAGINIQRITSDHNDSLNTDLDIHLNESGGRPLSPSTRQFMEPRFGVDFDHVRLHADQDANQTASQIQAKAFTYGHHIWLGKGESESDRTLMAHELTHVVQQGAAYNRQVQMARLPCTSRKKIDVYAVNLPGSTRSIHDDLTMANDILCQCGIEINVTGGVSWATNILDMNAPNGVLNEDASPTVDTAEVQAMTAYRPGGDVIHAYYVPANTLADRGGSYGYTGMHPSLPHSVSLTNIAAVDTLAHELGHVLLDDPSHHANRDNLMASGGIRNVGVDELEQTQCNRMP